MMTTGFDLECDARVEGDGRVVLEHLPLASGTEVHLCISVKKADGRRRLPEEFFEQTSGKIDDPTFERPPQGEYEVREPLE